MSNHEKINYLEFPSQNITATKVFFSQVFQWQFTDYGPDYTAFENAGISGGFFQSLLSSHTESGSALVVFYSENLTRTQQKIVDAKGKITKEIFSFPGGRRFHFTEPSGNEFAVWSDK